MLSGLLVCVLVMGAMASKPGMPTARGGPKEHPHKPHRCCAPRYYTYDQAMTTTSAVGGKLRIEEVNFEGAYDAVKERLSAKVVINYLNGTEVYLKEIVLYEENIDYLIFEHRGESVCYKHEPEGMFPENCLGEEFHFVNKVTLGDHDLELNSWYRVGGENRSEHTIKTVQEQGCAPVSFLRRTFDPVTGQELTVDQVKVFNVKLGICDPDEYFKLPESCEEGRALKKPTPEMVKFQSQKLFLHP